MLEKKGLSSKQIKWIMGILGNANTQQLKYINRTIITKIEAS